MGRSKTWNVKLESGNWNLEGICYDLHMRSCTIACTTLLRSRTCAPGSYLLVLLALTSDTFISQLHESPSPTMSSSLSSDSDDYMAKRPKSRCYSGKVTVSYGGLGWLKLNDGILNTSYRLTIQLIYLSHQTRAVLTSLLTQR